MTITVDDTHRRRTLIPEPARGEHLWVISALWAVNPAVEHLMLDEDNLMSIAGPICYVCEHVHSPLIAAIPCLGKPEHRS